MQTHTVLHLFNLMLWASNGHLEIYRGFNREKQAPKHVPVEHKPNQTIWFMSISTLNTTCSAFCYYHPEIYNSHDGYRLIKVQLVSCWISSTNFSSCTSFTHQRDSVYGRGRHKANTANTNTHTIILLMFLISSAAYGHYNNSSLKRLHGSNNKPLKWWWMLFMS